MGNNDKSGDQFPIGESCHLRIYELKEYYQGPALCQALQIVCWGCKKQLALQQLTIWRGVEKGGDK